MTRSADGRSENRGGGINYKLRSFVGTGFAFNSYKNRAGGHMFPCLHGSDGFDLIVGDERATALFDGDLIRLHTTKIFNEN